MFKPLKGLVLAAAIATALVPPAAASANHTVGWNEHPWTYRYAHPTVLPPNGALHRISSQSADYYSLKRRGEAEQYAAEAAVGWYERNVGPSTNVYSSGDVRSYKAASTPANLWNVHVHVYTVDSTGGGTDCDFNYTVTPLPDPPLSIEMQLQSTPVCGSF
jgi:hypothetical protein